MRHRQRDTTVHLRRQKRGALIESLLYMYSLIFDCNCVRNLFLTEKEYLKSLKAVVTEIINRQDKWLYNRHISSLYFEPFQPMRGVLDKSLEELTPWRSNDECQTMAVSALLQLIRVRVKADEGLLHSEGVMSPPDRDDEAEWREWIRLTVPRAIADVMAFIEATTGALTLL